MASVLEQTTMIMLRRATMDDIPALQAMFDRFVSSTAYQRYVGNNPEYSIDLIARLVAFEATSAVFVAEHRTAGVVGMLGIAVVQDPWSGIVIAEESMWWLNPEHRGHGGWLLRRAEKWAKDKGATKIRMMAPVGNQRVGHIYRTLGYAPVEVIFSKDLV